MRQPSPDLEAVSRAETGARQAGTLSLQSIAAFARALGTSIDALVGDDIPVARRRGRRIPGYPAATPPITKG